MLTSTITDRTANPTPHVVDVRVDALRLTVTRLARQLRRHSGTDLTPAQMSALNVLGCKGPMRVGRLALMEGISKPTATRLTSRLEDMGLVDRTHDHADARSWQLQINHQGECLLAEASRRADAYLAARMAELRTIDQHRLWEALPALVRLLELKA